MSPESKQRLDASRRLQEAGQVGDAWTELEGISPEDKALVEIMQQRLLVARELGKWEAVAVTSMDLSNLEPDDPWHAINLAEAVHELKGADEALNVCLPALERWPSDPYVNFALGRHLRNAGRLLEAAAAYRRAFKLKPDLGPDLGLSDEQVQQLVAMPKQVPDRESLINMQTVQIFLRRFLLWFFVSYGFIAFLRDSIRKFF